MQTDEIRAKQPARLDEVMAARDLELDAEVRARLDAAA